MLSPEMIAVFITAATGIFLGGGAWAKTQSDISKLSESVTKTQTDCKDSINVHRTELDEKIDSHIRDDKEAFGEFWKWKNNHEKDAADKREHIQETYHELKSRVDGHDQGINQVIKMLEEMRSDWKAFMSKH